MKTKAAIVFLLITCVTLFASPCRAWLETLMIQEPNRTIVVQGHFRDEPWGAFPGEQFFSYEEQSPQSSNHEKYYFHGVKEEGSFEIRHTWAKFGGFRAGKHGWQQDRGTSGHGQVEGNLSHGESPR